MSGAIRYICDLPIYRLGESEYYEQQRIWIDEQRYPADSPMRDSLICLDNENPARAEMVAEHFRESYGGSWLFNEIIGYVRLHFLGTQVRGEYYRVKAKRIVRTRRKQIEYRSWKLAPEIEIPDCASSDDIRQLIETYVNDCRAELPRRYIDDTILRTMGMYVDWRSMYDA
jgi:hypothetical protein